MPPIKKHRFTIIPENNQKEGMRIFSIEKEDLPHKGFRGIAIPKKYHPLIAALVLIAIVALAVAIVTVIKKPSSFLGDRQTIAEDSYKLLPGISDQKLTPEESSQNPHIVRGKTYYFKKNYTSAIDEFTQVVESDAPDSDKAIALTYIGMIYDDKGDYIKAIETFKRALKYKPNDSTILKNLALAYRHRKDYPNALATIQKAIDNDDSNPDLLILKGNIFYDMGKFPEAVKSYTKALDIAPNNPQALYNTGLTFLKTGDELSAVEYFKKAAAADPSGNIAKLAYSRLGAFYTGRRDYAMAEKYLTMAIQLDPNEPVNHYNLGIVYMQRQQYEKALAEFKAAESSGVYEEKLLEGLSEAYASLERYDESIAVLERLQPVQNRNIAIIARLAELYYRKGDLDTAFEYYKQITVYEPVSENARIAYANMGNIRDDQHRYEDAINFYKKALAIDPKDSSTLYNLGIAYKHAGKLELAVAAFNDAAQYNPDNPKPRLAIADLYYEKGYLDLALDEYIKVVRLWPNLQEAQFMLGMLYYNKGRNDYALEAFNRVIAINGNNEYAKKAYINIGIILSNAKDEKQQAQAVQSLQKALLISPNEPEALLAMGTIAYNQHKYDKAIEIFYQVLEASNEDSIVAQAYHNIGRCYYAKREYKKSLQFLTKASELDPTNEEIRLNRKVAMQAYEKELSLK
ncbi:MAG: tetratricopeptide repeat protein [Spirochaetes bacterium]|nr:tetratricopeptide repeat protein [Spirochaetota bacterium]